MVTLVERGTDEIIHAGIDDLEGFGGAALFVEAFGEEHAGVAHDVAARFEQDFQPEILEPGDEFLAVALDGQRALVDGLLFPPVDRAGFERVLVNDADAAADRPEFDAMAGLELDDKRRDFFHRLDERRDGRELRADVHLQAAQLDVFQLLGGALVEV